MNNNVLQHRLQPEKTAKNLLFLPGLEVWAPEAGRNGVLKIGFKPAKPVQRPAQAPEQFQSITR